MNSPFPGMDPYLEQYWRDVHSSMIIYARDQMQAVLPADLLARVEERVFVQDEEGGERGINPDVRVVEHGQGGGAAVAVLDAVDVAEPYVIARHEPENQTFIEIREVGDRNRLITVIEILSPTNKYPGPGNEQYRQKQMEVLRAFVNLVEIDLLRGGERQFPMEEVPARLHSPYQAVVRGPRRGSLFYGLPLRERLPAIRIPLRETDADVILRLQPLIEQCYRNGRYHTIDYRADAIPPLMGDDAVWADALLRAASKR